LAAKAGIAVDKGYINYERFYQIHQSKAYFVTRAKTNFAFQRIYSNKVDKSTGLICDQTVKLTVPKSAKEYPEYMPFFF
jgi:hypothetical protein